MRMKRWELRHKVYNVQSLQRAKDVLEEDPTTLENLREAIQIVVDTLIHKEAENGN